MGILVLSVVHKTKKNPRILMWQALPPQATVTLILWVNLTQNGEFRCKVVCMYIKWKNFEHTLHTKILKMKFTLAFSAAFIALISFAEGAPSGVGHYIFQ